jgi:hypothetical protein
MSGDRTLYLRALVMACAIAAAMIAPAQAQTSVGWVWGNEPDATGTYTPDATYSSNSSGGGITITPLGTGEYQVDFDGLYNSAHLNNVQVSAYETSGYCTVMYWDAEGGNNAAEMVVKCFDINGNPANSYFTLLYQQRTAPFGGPGKGMAFLWANEPTQQNYTPSSDYNYNSTGSANSIARNSVGNYTAFLPGLPGMHSDVQVTEYGATARCKVENWTSAGGGTLVNVLCFDNTGAAADEYYSLAYAADMPFGQIPAKTSRGAWAWANKDTAGKTYKPSTVYQFSSFKTGKLTALRTGTGSYTVSIPGSLDYAQSNMLVTGYGDGSGYCNIVSWGTDTMNVQCYTQGGSPADSQFDMSFQTNK